MLVTVKHFRFQMSVLTRYAYRKNFKSWYLLKFVDFEGSPSPYFEILEVGFDLNVLKISVNGQLRDVKWFQRRHSDLGDTWTNRNARIYNSVINFLKTYITTSIM